jgi:hypothetical protein
MRLPRQLRATFVAAQDINKLLNLSKKPQKYIVEKALHHNQHHHLTRILTLMVRASHLCHLAMRSENYVSRISSTTR